MRSWFYLLLAYVFLIAGAIVAGIHKDWVPLFACIAMGWCCKLESEK